MIIRHFKRSLAVTFLGLGIVTSPMCLAQTGGGWNSILPAWISASHDSANSNNQPLELLLSPITIKHFGLTTRLITLPTSTNELAPVISSDNIAYFGDSSFGNVYAVNIISGKMIFNVHISNAFYNDYPQFANNANNFPNTFFASPVLVGNYLFIADGNGVLYKVDRFTGAMIKKVTIGTPINNIYDIGAADYGNYPVNGKLAFANNVPAYVALGNMNVVYRSDEGSPPLIVFGLTSGDSDEEGDVDSAMTWEHSGAIVGINSQTMQVEWLTVIAPYGGGDNIWGGGPAIDQQRHLLYIGVGNLHTPPVNPNTPIAPDYSDSLIAVNYDTGQIVDHVQFSKGDMFSPCYSVGSSLCDPNANPPPPNNYISLAPTPDNWTSFINYISHPKYIINSTPNEPFILDIASSPNLFTINVKGKSVDVVGVDDKNGTYAVFNRDNLSQMYWASPSPLSSETYSNYEGESIAAGALDYQHGLIWVATTAVIPAPPYTVVSYMQALDMNTGTVKASFQVPAPAANPDSSYGVQAYGTAIANNVLYISDTDSGTLSLYDITNPTNPKLITQLWSPDGAGNIYFPYRNVAVVNGHIVEGVADYNSNYEPIGGGLIIYTLK